ncbi:MAG: alpha/beta hydrolase [Gammaproteobacteria bacterium]|nr:alpha/beta hydrolase [Gammaproteobacteria bacterium]
MRAAVQRWAVEQLLRGARAALARADTPGRVRALAARAAALFARRETYDASPPVDLGGVDGWWITPAGSPQAGIILYFHGGGFIAASRAIHDPLLAALGRASGARGLMIDYRLAPEHPFPAAPDDCFAAWNWMLSTGFDPARVVFAGDSAGGNLALVTAMRARDEGLPLPAALVLMSPVLDLTFSGASFVRNDGLDPMLRAATAARITERYAPGRDPADPRISPLFGQAAGLPPVMLLVGSSEILLDDTLRLSARLDGARTAVWHGMPHAFPAIRGLADGDRAIAEIADFIREHTAEATRGTQVPRAPA